MSIFSKLTTDNVEPTRDSLGGYQALESGIYLATIKAVYITMSRNNAMAANLLLDIDGREYREQLWITNSKGENWYKSSRTGNRMFLDGFTQLNDICLCACNKELKQMDTESRVFNVYSIESHKEVPTEVPTITELAGKQVALGILKETVNKRVKDSNGNYVDSAETKDENRINKVFHAEKHLTVNEARMGKTEPAFYDRWLEKNQGVTRNRVNPVANTVGAGQAQQLKEAPRSLFG